MVFGRRGRPSEEEKKEMQEFKAWKMRKAKEDQQKQHEEEKQQQEETQVVDSDTIESDNDNQDIPAEFDEILALEYQKLDLLIKYIRGIDNGNKKG